ncbi:hypothetical protein HY385_02410 [Candidatus Daviesbacteria bacterium]|nr:hypothetical protein [Candidatus Daviesbacteria bacterium]
MKIAWFFIILAPFFIVALLLTDLPAKRFQILILAALVYLLLTLLHHLKDKTLSWGVVIEYLLIAALALVISQGIF